MALLIFSITLSLYILTRFVYVKGSKLLGNYAYMTPISRYTQNNTPRSLIPRPQGVSDLIWLKKTISFKKRSFLHKVRMQIQLFPTGSSKIYLAAKKSMTKSTSKLKPTTTCLCSFLSKDGLTALSKKSLAKWSILGMVLESPLWFKTSSKPLNSFQDIFKPCANNNIFGIYNQHTPQHKSEGCTK